MATKVSKRIEELNKKIEDRAYGVEESSVKIKELASAKFDESIEIALNLNVDPRHADQMVRGSVVLPAGNGKTVRVAVLADSAKADEAKAAGADIVGSDDLVAEIKAGNINFDTLIATPNMMSKMGQIGRILGPKGLMPNPKTGTVTMDVTKAVNEAKGGKVNFKVDKKGNIHVAIGKVSFTSAKILENLNAFFLEINRLKPSTAKGKYITNAAISLTMSPSLKLDEAEIIEIKK